VEVKSSSPVKETYQNYLYNIAAVLASLNLCLKIVSSGHWEQFDKPCLPSYTWDLRP